MFLLPLSEFDLFRPNSLYKDGQEVFQDSGGQPINRPPLNTKVTMIYLRMSHRHKVKLNFKSNYTAMRRRESSCFPSERFCYLTFISSQLYFPPKFPTLKTTREMFLLTQLSSRNFINWLCAFSETFKNLRGMFYSHFCPVQITLCTTNRKEDPNHTSDPCCVKRLIKLAEAHVSVKFFD